MYLWVGTIIFLLTLGVIIVRPRHISEAAAAAAGAALLVVLGYVHPSTAVEAITSQWNLYGFFLGLMIVSAIAEEAGVFEMLASLAGRWARGSSLRLYLAVFAIGTLITAFLTNDATALILTPVVYALVSRLRLPVLPFMFACTFIADSASFLLPVSNPINVLVLDSFSGNGLGTFLRYLLLPSLVCIGLNTGLFIWLFRRDLRHSYNLGDLQHFKPDNLHYFRFVLIAMALIAAAYLAASALQIPLSFIALSAAALLLAGSAYFRALNFTKLRKGISWSLFVFVTGMFLMIKAVENLGLTAAFGNALLHLSGNSPFRSVLLIAGGSALGANLINNLPMALVMVSALSKIGITPANVHLVYATILGADLGPNLTTVGSLATMLWLLILRRKGLDISSLEYFRLGILFVPVIVVIGSVLIWLGV
jgi:arsenical pump membrane protein